MPALSDRDARAVTRLVQAFFHLIESEPEAGSLRSLGRATGKTEASRLLGRAGVIDQQSPYAILMLSLRGPESWYGIPVLGDSSFWRQPSTRGRGCDDCQHGVFIEMQSS